MEATELTNENTGFEFKPGGYNRWSDVKEDTSTFRPIFGDEPNEENTAEEGTENEPEKAATDVVENTFVEKPLDGNEIEAEQEGEAHVEAEEQVEDGDEDTPNNPAYFIAQQLASEGVLELGEINKDINFGDIYNNYKTNLEPRAKNEILSEVGKTLEQAGITDENIVMLQAIQNGIPVDELYVVSRYDKFGSLTEDDDVDKKMEVIREWYSLRDLSQREIDRNLNAIELDDEVDVEFEQARTFFKTTVDNFKEEQKNISLQQLQLEHQARQQNQAILDNAIKMGRIGNETLSSEQSKQLSNDIYKKTEVLQMGNENINVSPFEKFLYEINNSLEFQLQQYKNYKYKDSTQAGLAKKVEEETTRDFVKAWQDQQKKTTSKTSIKRGASDTREGRTQTGGIRYEI